MGVWCKGISLHTSACSPLMVFVDRWSQSCSNDWSQLTTCRIGRARGGGQVWLHILCCPMWAQTQPWAHTLGGQVTLWAGSNPGRGGDQNVPVPWLGPCLRAGGFGTTSCWHFLPLPLSALSAAALPIPIGIPEHTTSQWPAGVMGGTLPSPPAAFIPGRLPPPPPFPTRAPRGWQENNSEEDE